MTEGTARQPSEAVQLVVRMSGCELLATKLLCHKDTASSSSLILLRHSYLLNASALTYCASVPSKLEVDRLLYLHGAESPSLVEGLHPAGLLVTLGNHTRFCIGGMCPT